MQRKAETGLPLARSSSETAARAPSQSTRRRWPGWVAVTLGILVIGTGVGWAGAVILIPPKDILDSSSFTYVEVVDGEVGSSINLNTVAAWTPIPVGSNLASGTVTSVNLSAGQEVGVGSVLYTVNLRPVVVGQGQIPSFQPLSLGASGADVAQLQSMLSSLGFYSYEVDGEFDWITQQAVQDWQTALGIDDDGSVQAGDIIYVPTLPTRLSLDTDKVSRGASLSGGEEVLRGLPASPTFTIPVTQTQAALIPAGTRVEITGPDGQLWAGYAADHQPSDQGEGFTVVLQGADGGTICGDDCGSIQVSEEALLRSRIVTVETVRGLTVPSAALRSASDGSLVVVDRKGVEHPVTVVESARGMSVIEGVAVGTSVRVPATAG